MKQLVVLALLLVSVGCLDSLKKSKSESADKKSDKAAPAQTAAPSGSNVVMPGGPGGGVVVGDLSGTSANQPAPAQTTPQPAAQPTVPAASQEPGKLVDATEALKNPKVVVASTKITAEDPLSASMQAYFSIRAKAQILNFQHQLKISKELNDGKPLSYDQFMELVHQLKVDFIALPPWQMIGYDAKAGDLMLLEDKGEKIKRYKAANIAIDPADQKYDTP